jgi:hypothetical protein
MKTKRQRRHLKKDNPTWPPKYYKGLPGTAAKSRRKEILKYGALHWKNPKAYVGFKTDKNPAIIRRSSSYTQRFRKLFPAAKSLKQKADATGVPEKFLRESYNRGMAAWRTGHRPGATEQQWGYARAHSLLLCGKTAQTTDADIVRHASAASLTAKKWFAKTCKAERGKN